MASQTTSSVKDVSSDWSLPARLLACVVALTVMRSVAFNSAEADLWGHVLYGSEIVRSGSIPATTTHSFTATSFHWINHEILAEVALAIGAHAIGIDGLLICKALLGALIFVLMAWCSRINGIHATSQCVLLFLVANCLELFFVLRPQVISFVLLSLMLTILTTVFRNWSVGQVRTDRLSCLWLLPLIFIVWANSHGGFLAGLGILITYFAGRSIEAVRRLGIKSIQMIVQLFVVSLTCALATLVNPYGVYLITWLVTSLSVPRPEIAEWCPIYPEVIGFSSFVTLLGISITVLTATKEKRDWTHVIILAVLAWQSLLHFRHIALFAIACGFWLPAHLQSTLSSVAVYLQPVLSRLASSRPLSLSVTFVLSAVIAVSTFRLVNSFQILPVDGNEYPIDAIHFMHENRISGRAVVSFNWAQYAIAALPDLTVAFDGRYDTSYPQDVIDMNLDFMLGENNGRRFRGESSGSIDRHRVLTHCAPELVLMDRRFPDSVHAMATTGQGSWDILYQDAVSQLWGRREVFGNPNSSRYISRSRRIICDLPSKSLLNWPALPGGIETP